MNTQVIYIVTQYGCNSTPGDMWTPKSKIFTNYKNAYDYFLKVSPSLDDKYNNAEQYVNKNYEEKELTGEYTIIENRVHSAGYHDGVANCAKRPMGAVIARSIINFN